VSHPSSSPRRLPRSTVPFALVGIALLIAEASLGQSARIQARDADRFVDSVGVNVHMESANTPYRNYFEINRRLHELGMRHIRDEINDTDPAFVNEIQRFGTLGYTLCGLIEGGNDYPPLGTRLDPGAVVSIIQNLQPTIDAVEGPNEPDDGGFVYDGVPYPQGAINESEDLWNIVKGNSATSTLPVLTMSEGNAVDFTQLAAITPPPIDYATYGNMHAYQGGGVGDTLLGWYMHYSRTLSDEDALWTTEMGYHNNTKYLSDGEQQGVSERAAAIYLPTAFLGEFDRGVERTFSYELIDEANDPKLISGSGEGHYGLLHYDGSPKPAFTAMRNLIALLREPEHKAFTLGSLAITFSGALRSLRFTLLQTSDESYYLALWNDVSVYELASPGQDGEDLYPRPVPITMTFDEPKTITIYAPNDASGIHPTSAYTISESARSIQLELPAQVLLLKIVND
jgi:hypothetical protein